MDNVFSSLVNKSARGFCLVCFFAAGLLMVGALQPSAGAPKPDRIIEPANLSAAQERASRLNQPLLLLVTESGSSRADDQARNAFESRSVRQKADGKVLLAMMDLSVSRVRATATRFHPLETPLLVCLSPRGIVLSRSQKPITQERILQDMRQAVETSPETDRKLGELENAAHNSKNDSSAQLALADFLMEHNNAFEAIPILEVVAHSKNVSTPVRIRVWADLVRANFWIAEPEKAHREAMDLIAELGTANPEARAAANLMLGNQDATNPKRIERARQEFREAVSAAPESVYGKQAAAALANLPKGSQ